ncbi:MAG: hypothetical protein JNJ73_17995 [Hyphomonadaceae bacterium]|nr:hypothetical protein [Hyphomonadaceae bacterium]
MIRALATALMLFGASAAAQTSNAPAPARGALAGAWAFETNAHRITGCIIRGDALLRARAEADSYDVEMRVAETCPDGGAYRAEEACLARLDRGTLNVACRLVRATPPNYNPDQFSLTIDSAEAMHGRLVDHGAWNEPVRWRKSTGALVS